MCRKKYLIFFKLIFSFRKNCYEFFFKKVCCVYFSQKNLQEIFCKILNFKITNYSQNITYRLKFIRKITKNTFPANYYKIVRKFL